jgi:hypothetical protein
MEMKRKYFTEDGEIFDHKTKDGRYIPLDKLEDSHLLNILKFYKRRAKEGIKIFNNFSSGSDNMSLLDFETLYGEAALEALNYYAYEEEAKLRWGNKDV